MALCKVLLGIQWSVVSYLRENYLNTYWWMNIEMPATISVSFTITEDDIKVQWDALMPIRILFHRSHAFITQLEIAPLTSLFLFFLLINFECSASAFTQNCQQSLGISNGLSAMSESPYNTSKGNHTSCSSPYLYMCLCMHMSIWL